MTYYIFKKGTNTIINACETDGYWSPDSQQKYLSLLIGGADNYEVKPENQIPLATLKTYRYWDERP